MFFSKVYLKNKFKIIKQIIKETEKNITGIKAAQKDYKFKFLMNITKNVLNFYINVVGIRSFLFAISLFEV